ncbi:hypothetical protein M0802_001494 [Mischocyttarus mexicanus]|nr:hypothetical protein M0802_001494 [Mischocyttarus mexicanus]
MVDGGGRGGGEGGWLVGVPAWKSRGMGDMAVTVWNAWNVARHGAQQLGQGKATANPASFLSVHLDSPFLRLSSTNTTKSQPPPPPPPR